MAKGRPVLTRHGAVRVYVCRLSLSTIYLQVVQRSLSGGFLTEDAALLNANACSMSYVSDEARDNMPWERAALTRATSRARRRRGAPHPRHPHSESSLTHTTLLTFTFTKRRCWSWRPQATRPRTPARSTTMKLLRLPRYSLAPRIGTMLPPGSPTMVRASTCRYSMPRAESVHVRPPQRPPAPAATARRPAPPPARLRRLQVLASWQRGSAQATPPQTPSVAPAWRRRTSPASPPSCSRRTRPSP